MRLYRRCLLAAMRAKWVTILVTACLFGAALYGTRFVPEQFFPSSDRPELLVDLKLQDNASIYATRDVAAAFDKIVGADPDVVRFSTYVGQGAIRFYLPIDVALPNDFFAQSVVVTKGLKERDAGAQAPGGDARGALPRRGRTRLSARARPSGRLADQIPGEWA